MDTVFVKPREGARVRQPERGGRVMPSAGSFVPRNAFYERMIATGEILLSEPIKKLKASADSEQNSNRAAGHIRRRPSTIQSSSEG